MTFYVSAPGARYGGLRGIRRQSRQSYAPVARRAGRAARFGAQMARMHRSRMGFRDQFEPYGTLAIRLAGRAYRR